jgi:hypothetical protein
MKRFVRSLLASLTFTFASGAHTAFAQARDPAAAQALFDEARRLSAAGRYAEACDKLAESNRLDPGMGTQFHLADCQEKSGKIASAWANFLEVASLARSAGQSEREQAALGRAAKLEPRLPRIVLEVPADSRVTGLEIRRDGLVVGSAQWGSPVPVDPGEHEVVVSAPGKRPFTRKLRAELAKTARLAVPVLEDDPSAAAGSVAAVPVAAAAVAQPADAAPPERTQPANEAPAPEPVAAQSGPNPLVYVLGGAGIVGLGVGTAFALMAKSTNDDSKAECRPDDPNVCNGDGVAMRDDALAQGNVATVAFVVGGAALAGAAVWFVLDSGSTEKRSASALRAGITATPRGGTLLVDGRF